MSLRIILLPCFISISSKPLLHIFCLWDFFFIVVVWIFDIVLGRRVRLIIPTPSCLEVESRDIALKIF